MSLWKYKYFVDVVESKSFTKAGKKNYVSQTAISQQISSLEKSIGGRLIDRGSGEIAVTGLGEIVYAKAKDMLEIYEEMSREINQLSKTPTIRIGVDNSINKLFWEKIMNLASDFYRESELQFSRQDSDIGSRMLEEDRLDIFIGYNVRPGDGKAELIKLDIISSSLGVYVGEHTSLASGDKIFLKDLEGRTRYETKMYLCSIQEDKKESICSLPGRVKSEDNVDTMKLKVDFYDAYAFVDSRFFPSYEGSIRLLEDYDGMCTIKAFYKKKQKNEDCVQFIEAVRLNFQS